MRGPIEGILEPAIDEQRIASTWQRIREARAVRRRGFSLPRWSFALAAAATAAVAAYVTWPSSHVGPLASRSPTVAINAGAVLDATAQRVVRLDDGSALDLDGGARLQVLTNDAERFVTLLQHGRAHFDVQPGGPRRWEIETSRATVEVVGTAFVVDAEDHRLVVEVERGVVMVRGERVPGRVVWLTAGQHIAIEDPALKTAVAPPPPPPVPPPSAEAPAVQVAPAVAEPDVKPSSAPPAKPTRSHTAKSGASTHHAIAQGAQANETTPYTLATALIDADQRRNAGDPAGAAALLEHALIGAPHDESTGLVEFTLGRLYLEDLGAPDRAEAAFTKMIAGGGPHGLLEDARARRVEALVRGRRRDDARAALDEYDQLYPKGVHRAALHNLLAR